MSKKKRYTVMEGIWVYKTLGAKKSGKIDNSLWKIIENQRLIPERSADSLKAFWKKHSNMTMENYLVECLFFKTDFCLSFKNIPNEEFVDRHQERFAEQFQALAQQHHIEQVPEDELGSDGPIQEVVNDDDEAFPDEEDRSYARPAVQTLFDIDDEQDKKPSAGSEKEEFASPNCEVQATAQSTAVTSKQVDTDKQAKGTEFSNKQTREFEPMETNGTNMNNQKDIGSLISEETKVEQLRPKPTVQMKKVKKLVGMKRSYNMYEEANSLIYTTENRPFQTIENICETLKQKRHREHVPKDSEVPELDRERFNKQMILEIVDIKVNEKTYRQRGTIIPALYRTVVRKNDIAGSFMLIQREFEQWAKEYGIDVEEVSMLF